MPDTPESPDLRNTPDEVWTLVQQDVDKMRGQAPSRTDGDALVSTYRGLLEAVVYLRRCIYERDGQ